MEKNVIIGITAMLLVGVALVSASSFYGEHQMYDHHQEMHAGYSQGYDEDFRGGCPMHNQMSDVTAEDLQIMQGWMMSGDFPKEKPKGLSDEAWKLHTSHHPEVYD